MENGHLESSLSSFYRLVRSPKIAAFTLIELLIVIAVIGMLSAIILSSVSSGRAKSRDAKRVDELREMGKTLFLNDKEPAQNLAGCNAAAHTDASTCNGPAPINFQYYKDVITPGTACTNLSVSTCQYSISRAGGAAGPTTQDFEVCSYLEIGVPGLTAGLVRVATDRGGNVVQGCI